MGRQDRISNGAYNGMYRPEFEHDNCGIGAIVNIKGLKTHDTVEIELAKMPKVRLVME